MRKQFYVYKRNGAVYYMQFTDPITGKVLTPHSTGKRTEQEAIDKAYQLLYSQDITPTPKLVPNFAQSFLKLVADNKIPQSELLQIQQSLGIYSDKDTTQEVPQTLPQVAPSTPQVEAPQQAEHTPLTQWLADFWTFETSEYVQDKISHGKRVGKRYCYEQKNIVKYWEEYFNPDFTLEELNSKHLELFEKYLWDKEIQKKRTAINPDTGKKFIQIYTTKLSNTTRNNIIKCASITFEWAVRKHIMTANPCNSLTSYSIKSKERGILNRKVILSNILCAKNL